MKQTVIRLTKSLDHAAIPLSMPVSEALLFLWPGMEPWLKENTPSFVDYMVGPPMWAHDDNVLLLFADFFFEDDAEAILFKLRWC